jgi:hypothetical protein
MRIVLSLMICIVLCSFFVSASYLECDQGLFGVSSDYNAVLEEIPEDDYLTNCDLYVVDEDGEVITDIIKMEGGWFDAVVGEEGRLELEFNEPGLDSETITINGYGIHVERGEVFSFLGDDWIFVDIPSNKEVIFDKFSVFTEGQSGSFQYKTESFEEEEFLSLDFTENIFLYMEDDTKNIFINGINLDVPINTLVSYEEEEELLKFVLNEQESCVSDTVRDVELKVFGVEDDGNYTLFQDKCNTEIYLRDSINEYFKVISNFFGNNVNFTIVNDLNLYVGEFKLSDKDELVIMHEENSFFGSVQIKEDSQTREQIKVCGFTNNRAEGVTLGEGTDIGFEIKDHEEGMACTINSCTFDKNSECEDCGGEDYILNCDVDRPNFVVGYEYMNELVFEEGVWSCGRVDCFRTLEYLVFLDFNLNFFSPHVANNFYLNLFEEDLPLGTIVNFNELEFDSKNWLYRLNSDSFVVEDIRFMPGDNQAYITQGSLIVSLNYGVVFDQEKDEGYVLKEGTENKYDFYVDENGLTNIDCCKGLLSEDSLSELGQGEGVPMWGCNSKVIREGSIYGKDNVYILESTEECKVHIRSLEELKEGNRVVEKGEIEDILDEQTPFGEYALPMDPDKVKAFNNGLHTILADGHGVVRANDVKAAVDLRAGKNCQESYDGSLNGIPIYSSFEGEVVSVFKLPSKVNAEKGIGPEDIGKYGKCIVVTADGSSCPVSSKYNSALCPAETVGVYCHVDPLVSRGGTVAAGQLIGYLTAYPVESSCVGPHLHYELKLGGEWITGDGRGGTWNNQMAALNSAVA